MNITCKELRQLGKQARNRNLGNIMLIVILAGIITGALAFTGIGTLLVAGPLALGIAIASLKLARNQDIKIGTLFDGFEQFGTALLGYILMAVYTALWTMLLIIPGIVAGYKYSMTFYIIADYPELSANDAISKSKELMDGYKWKLFCLHLSFIGWWLLSCMTFGLLLLWVMPHIECTNAVFYEYVRRQKGWTRNSDEGTFDMEQKSRPVDSYGEPI